MADFITNEVSLDAHGRNDGMFISRGKGLFFLSHEEIRALAAWSDKQYADDAPPSIADMVPGTTFTAEFTASGFNGERTRWLRDEHGLVLASTGLRISAFSIDPSTIRDVTPPAVTP